MAEKTKIVETPPVVSFSNRFSRIAGAVGCALLGALASPAGANETIAVSAEVIGSTPESLGYNLGHFLEGTNAADWFRYSGADSARLFMRVTDLEPDDDLPPVGDGVTGEASFFARRALMRANAADPDVPLSPAYANWDYFTANLAKLSGGVNVLRYSHVLETLRDAGVSVLVNLTASPGRFPLTGPDDWPGRWELWQHYYAVAFLLARDYDVFRFSMFNEPNLSDLDEAQWHERLRICSDAIQAAVADMNARHGRALAPEVFAPTTANGAEKYHNPGADVWGSTAVLNRHTRLDGTSDPGWSNLHVYSYQKYTTRQIAAGGFSGFLTDYDTLRGLIDADTPAGPRLPLALTEFNVRTGANYDTTPLTLDSPVDFTSLGASLAGLSARGMERIYLFKFAQTPSNSFYGVAKNGTHFSQNAAGSLHQYGGATRGAEVYRLFLKAARGARPIHRVTASGGASPGVNNGLWTLATRNDGCGMAYLFLSNRDERTIRLDVDFSPMGIPPENPFVIEQVDATRFGGVVRTGKLAAGKSGALEMPPQSVWLLGVPTEYAAKIARDAVADTRLDDGPAATVPGGQIDTLDVRADGTVGGRRVALIRLPVPEADAGETRRVLLEMDVGSDTDGVTAQAHVYGIDHNAWPEETITWQQAAAFLKSGVPDGNRIEHNVVTGHGGAARILGQLAADSAEMQRMGIDVTDFALSRADGLASFLVVQEHRWDVAVPSLDSGDTQPAGLRIRSRRNPGGTPPRLVAFVSGQPPVIDVHPQSSVLPEESPLMLAAEAGGSEPIEFQWLRDGVALEGENGSTLAIPSATDFDSGIYQVTATNSYGSATSGAARVLVYAPGTARVWREASVRGGAFAGQNVDEAADGYLMVKHSADLSFARKSYLQFDLPPGIADPDAPATLTLRFQNTFSHQVRLWALSGLSGDIDPSMTWSQAPANSTGDNEMLGTGTPAATLLVDSTRIAPGSALAPHSFALPRLGDLIADDRVIVALTGVDDEFNQSGGLRLALESATLGYQARQPPSPWRQWQLERFGEDADDPLIAGPGADPDRDGLANLLEYALGGNPQTPDFTLFPRIRTEGPNIEIGFLRDPAATGIDLACQRAHSPAGAWTDIARAVAGGPMTSLVLEVEISEREKPDGRREVAITLLPAHPERGFFRLEARLADD